MSDVFTLNGTALDLVATDAIPTKFAERFGEIPTLTLQRRGILPPTEAADTWLGKTLTWSNGGTTYFSGDIVSRNLRRDNVAGWVIDYTAFGLRHRGDKVPHTDATTGLNSSAYNCAPEDLVNYQASRAGRTVGQILADVLTMTTNATNLHNYGLGAYTTLTPPTLPAATVADLAALSVIPPRSVTIGNDKILGGIDGFLSGEAPNVKLWVQPDGTLRFLDTRSFASSTLTMGSDPIEPVTLSRDSGNCFQRVEVRGAPIALMFLLKLSQGALTEDFAWGALTSAQAKSAFKPSDFKGTSSQQDTGTCTCPTTTTIAVTSSSSSEAWIANFWDQTPAGNKGTVNLYYTAGSGITLAWTARIVSNTALSAGGTSTLTIDNPLPALNFNRYTITGSTNGASLVYRKYKITDTALWPLVVNQATYAQAFSNAGGGASVTSSPTGMVLWSATQGSTSPPYLTFPLPFTYDGAGHLTFAAPTYVVAQNQAPADVWALLPINTGTNQVVAPADISGVPQYTGTSHTVEGWADTLVVTVPQWRDPTQATQVQTWAADILDSVKDAPIQGSVTYHGLYTPALTFGLALNVAAHGDTGASYTTGWESAALPVLEVDVEWSQGADDYVTTMGLSNRRAHHSLDQFLHPERGWMSFGLGQGSTEALGGGSGYEAQLSGYRESLQAASQPYNDALGRYGSAAHEAESGTTGAHGTDLGSSDLPAGYGAGGDMGVDPSGGMDFSGPGNNLASTGTLENLLSKADKPTMIHSDSDGGKFTDG